MAGRRHAKRTRGYTFIALAPRVEDTRPEGQTVVWILLAICICAAFWSVVFAALLVARSGL